MSDQTTDPRDAEIERLQAALYPFALLAMTERFCRASRLGLELRARVVGDEDEGGVAIRPADISRAAAVLWGTFNARP